MKTTKNRKKKKKKNQNSQRNKNPTSNLTFKKLKKSVTKQSQQVKGVTHTPFCLQARAVHTVLVGR